MIEIESRYPLDWPLACKRATSRRWGQFKVSEGQAIASLARELERLGAIDVILSTNKRARLDGLPYGRQGEPVDPGVAVFFDRDGRAVTMACDQYDKVWKNCRALALTIESMRRIERHGGTELMDRAFQGFEALPAPEGAIQVAETWRQVFGFASENEPLDIELVRIRYHELAKENHPDRGGTNEAMARINAAYEQAKAELGVTA